MFLKSIHLKNVKCFSDIDLSFENEGGDIRKRTLLLAENGAGKSTLLKAIALVTAGSDAITDLLGEPSDWIRYKKHGCEISAVLETNEKEERKINLRIESKDTRADVIVKNKPYSTLMRPLNRSMPGQWTSTTSETALHWKPSERYSAIYYRR